jgi:mono/diheme cytochrome c family protein
MLYRCFVLILGMIFLIFNGCITLERSLPTAETLLTYDTVPKDVDTKALNRGRALAVTQCSSCHRFFFPDEYLPEEWRAIIRNMAQRMSLNQKQVEDIDLYFQVASRALG